MKVEVAVLDSPVPNKPRGLCERKATLNQIKCSRSVPLSLPCGQLYVYTIGGQTGVCMCVRVYVRARARARVSVCVCVLRVVTAVQFQLWHCSNRRKRWM